MEKKTYQINEQVSKKYLEVIRKNLGAQRNIQTHLRNLEQVKQYVSKFQFDQRSRGKRAATTHQGLTLTRERKNSLEKLYTTYSVLEAAKKDLISQFQSIASSHSSDLHLSEPHTSSSPDFTQVSRSLRTIAFNSHKIKTPGSELQVPSENWSQNPYIHFYDSEQEYKDAISSLSQVLEVIKAQERSLQAEQSHLLGSWMTRPRVQQAIAKQKSHIAKLKAGATSHIELQVAAKILSWIGQLNGRQATKD